MKIRTLTLAAALLALLAIPAFAHGFKVGSIEIEHPWARASAGSAENGAAYMVLNNEGKEADKLVAASSPAADRVELHTHIDEGGVMKMRQINTVDIASGGTVKLAPGGLHVMLLGLKAPLVKGKAFPLTLTFEKAGTVLVEISVQGAGDAHADHDGKGGEHHDHHD